LTDDQMPEAPPPRDHTPRYQFGESVFDPRTGELVTGDVTTQLSPLPGRLLTHLLATAGTLVSREELWAVLWPGERIDLDQKLNFCVYQVRQALGQNAVDPRCLETLPRRGYRFSPEVRVEALPADEPAASLVSVDAVDPGRPGRRRRWTALGMASAAILAGTIVAGSAGVFGWLRGGRAAGLETRAVPEDYQVARYLVEDAPDQARLIQAATLLDGVIQKDPSFAPAYVTLSLVREELGAPAEARRLIDVALDLDERSAEGHHILGRMLFDRWDWSGAERHLERAVALEPTRAGAHHLLAHRAIVTGETEAAIQHANAARRLDPVTGRIQADLGWIYLWAGDLDEAVRQCEQSVALVGTAALNEECLIAARIGQGRLADAARLARDRMTRAGVDSAMVPTGPAGQMLERYYRWVEERLSRAEGSNAYGRARSLAYQGDDDRAFAMLRIAVDRHDPAAVYANADPYFRRMRADARFQPLARAMNLRPRTVTASAVKTR
jgi:DNA-binding winged helix-turn-helix (wHTH) protein/tetratricopeptide (TPR) repeat protein